MTDIYIVGTGMVGYTQLTMQARQALERAERTYIVDGQPLVVDHVRSEYCEEVVDLSEEYTDGENRAEIYERMARRVLDDAEETDGPVTLALYGHPMVFVSPSQIVIERAPRRGLDVEVQPGISAIDCIYADLGFDPAENGVQMFEATDLLLREFPLNPEVPAMIWQIEAVETIHHTERGSDPVKYERFRDYLLEFYPDDHEVHLLQTAMYPVADSIQLSVELGNLESLTPQLDDGAYIMYVPPVRERPIQNERLVEELRSDDHVELITRD